MLLLYIMNNLIKNEEEIRAIREGGKILHAILKAIGKEIKPGANTADLEALACKMADEAGARPAFKNYPMGGGIFFPDMLCISINDEVVHGTATPGRILKSGDIIDIDLGIEWPAEESVRQKFNLPKNPHSPLGGFFTDMSYTFPVGKVSTATKKLLQVTRECLEKGLKAIKPGLKIGELGWVIQEHAEKHGYGVVRDLVGHGVGYLAHEDPAVFNYKIPDDDPENITIEEGMVLAVEPMINAGTWRIRVDKGNKYTIKTADGTMSAHFEHTVAVTKNGCEILTAE